MSPIKRFLLTLALTAMWSPSFLFIKLAVQDLPPSTIAFFRVSLAALILCGMLICLKRSMPFNRPFWMRMSVMAFFSSVLPFALFCYAEKTIDSALAAILNGSTPMFTAIFAHLFVSSDRISLHKATGIALGCGGLVILFIPKILDGLNGSLIGMIAGMIASISYAVSHVYAKVYTVGQKPYVAPAAQLSISALFLLPAALFYDDFLHLPMPSLSAMAGVCGLALMGTVLAFSLYYKLLEHCGPTAISMVACFFPVVGMFLGFLFLGESFTTWGLIGACFIVIGMMIVNEVLVLDFLKPKPETPLDPLIGK